MADQVADQVASLGINLEDGVSSPAMAAAGALGKLRSSIDQDTKALAAMEKSMKNLQRGGVVNIAMYKDLKAKIDAKKQSIASAEASYVALGGSWNNARRPGNGFSEMLAKMKGNADQLGGPLGEVSGKIGFIGKLLSGGGVVLGLTLVAAGLAAITVAALAATGALVAYGIAAANVHRTELLQIEGMTKVRNWYGLAAGNAKEMQSAIDKVSGSVAIGRDKVAGYSAQLYKMGLRGEALTIALEGMSTAGSAAGDEQANHFAGMAAAANRTGQSVKRLADDVKARFGGVVARQMLDLDVQSKKLHESFSALFFGLDLDPLLKGVTMITSLFSQSTASGRALKTLMTGLIQPMIAAIEYAAPLAKRFFQGMVIGALVLTIALLKAKKWFTEAFGLDTVKKLDLTRVAIYAGVAAVAALGTAVVATGALIVGALVLATPFIWGAVVALGAMAVAGLAAAAPFILGAIAIGALIAAGYQLYKLWEEIDWTSLGSAIVDGIVGGIKGGAQWVVDAVSGLGDSAVKAFKSTLGIASPSKEFAKMGTNIAQGAEQGVRRGTPSLQGAVENMVDVPSAGSGLVGGSGATFNWSGNIVIEGAGKDSEEIGNDLKRKIESLMEGVLTQLGATT